MRKKKLFDWKTIGMVLGIIATTSISFLLLNKAFNWFDFDQLKVIEPETSESVEDQESTETTESGEEALFVIDYSSVEV